MVKERVFDFEVNNIGFPEVEGGKGVDGEGTFAVIESFPLIRDTHDLRTVVPYCFNCLDMRIINREEVEVVISATFVGKFGVCRCILV